MRLFRLWPPVALLVAGGAGADPPAPVTWAHITAQPAPPPGERIAYGTDSLQYGELRVPVGAGPFPLVVLIHGGCWQNAYGVNHVLPLAAALTGEGFATWAIEYRRLGDPGGGWPGTFADAALALDHVRTLAATHPVDLERVVLMGHSAGGHLALWLASRGRLPDSSRFARRAAVRIRGVVALAAITDLAGYGEGEGSCNASVHPLMGGAPEQVPARYAEGDPLRLLPPGAPVRLVHGAVDPIVPPGQAEAYARAARAAGGVAALVPMEQAGHFDLIAPFAPAWRVVLEQVREVSGAR